MQEPSNPAARRTAVTILFVFLATSAMGALSALQGNTRLSLYLCGAAIVVNLIVLLVGAWAVAASRAVEEVDSSNE